MHTKRFMLTILLLLFAGAASAQITVTAETIPGVGLVYLRHISNWDQQVNNGSSGANQVWNITTNSWMATQNLRTVTPGSTPYTSSYPSATHCISYSNDNQIVSYVYNRLTETGLYDLGIAYVNDVPSVYNPTGLIIPLPLSNTQAPWTNVIRFSYSGTTSFDSIICVVDGWGTINTPFGSAQVLRVFNRDFSSSSMQPGVVYRSVGYSWYDSRGIEVVNVMSNDGVTLPNFTVGSVNIMGIETESAEPPRGPIARGFIVEQNYPNPFNPTTTLPISLEKTGHVSLDIYDETGRLISHNEHEMPAGTHEMAVDGSAWASGSYFARVSAQDQSQTVKMQMVK